MNKVFLIGRLTKDPEVREATIGKVARYTIAVDRRNKDAKANKESKADFIPVVTFMKGAEFAETYLHKGMKIAVTGRIQTGSYTNKDGQTVYTTDIIADEQEFCESRQTEKPAENGLPGFMNIPQGMDEELPFS